MTAEAIEDTTNKIESRVRKELPQMRKIFIEVDAHGDGRGVEALRALGRDVEAAQGVTTRAEPKDAT
jgi:hypothetical protein